MTTWEITIGLETHVQLSTQSKIFSSASTAFGAQPNTQASAVCMALPGVLPVMNRAAVEKAMAFGLAIGAKIEQVSQFERKNYFYPDLPKAYQITQLAVPLVVGGSIDIVTSKGEQTIQLTRAHMEEDAGKSVHEGFTAQSGIDLNRAGTPLIEVVTEPVMHSSEEAVAYARALHGLVTWLGICDGNMQEGSFRCDANVSVRRVFANGSKEPLGTRREIKNLNSFKFMQQAIDYEARWQIEQIEDGHTIVQATVLFNSDTGETRAMRNKEDANDYRYFPDPDLPPLVVSDAWLARVKASLPRLPAELRADFIAQGLSPYDAAVLTQSKAICSYFEAVSAASGQPKLAANWVMGELSAALNKGGMELDAAPVTAAQLGLLVKRIGDGTISNAIGKKLFAELWAHPSENPAQVDVLIDAQGLKQITDTGAIEAMIDGVLTANAAMVAEYQGGKLAAFNALVGQCMKAAKGKASPAVVNELLKQKLG